MDGTTLRSQDERLALLSVWTIPGMGPASLDVLQAHCRASGGLASLLDLPPRQWMAAFELSDAVRGRLERVGALRDIGERISEKARAGGMGIAFAGDAPYPEALVGAPDAPPLLFHVGTPGAPKRCAAMVGSRYPEQGFLPKAQKLARQVAEGGVCVVSGAAEGVDQKCHEGALEARGETWAFVGSALDQLDPAQAALLPRVLEGGGVFFSELPPGVRASKQSFPRRNRLVTGASHVVVILRAGARSGCLHTAEAAMKQRRPIMAVPGDPDLDSTAFTNELLRRGLAAHCFGAQDVWRELHLEARDVSAPAPEPAVPTERAPLSAIAQATYDALPEDVVDFDFVRDATRLEAGTLTSALCELELAGLVVQHPGKRYERT